jgi:hypothetical protein
MKGRNSLILINSQRESPPDNTNFSVEKSNVEMDYGTE